MDRIRFRRSQAQQETHESERNGYTVLMDQLLPISESWKHLRANLTCLARTGPAVLLL